jgi:type II secretory pathway predicted ATPase ExeA
MKSLRAIAKACGRSPATINLILKHGIYPKGGAAELQKMLLAMGLPAPELTTTPKETRMLRKQSLLPKARQVFHFRGDPLGAEARSADDVHMNDNARYVAQALYMTAKHGGMTAVVGESGSGKSTLRRHLRDRLQRENLPIIVIEPYVIQMDDAGDRGRPLRADQIAEAILYALAPSARPPRSPEARYRMLHKLLQDSARAGNRHVLIIEEAHDLHGKTLKHLKRFYELEDGFNRLLSIILFGQNEMKGKLGENNPETREVTQRMELVELRPLHDPEGYVRHRLERAGMKFEALFAPDAMDALRLKHARHERGKREAESLLYPLAIGNTLTAACNLAAELGMDKITGDIIHRV